MVTVTSGWSDQVPDGVTMKQILASSISENHVGKAVYEEFLPKALAAGSFISAPDPLNAGKGLEILQGAMCLQMRGISAQKVVVLL